MFTIMSAQTSAGLPQSSVYTVREEYRKVGEVEAEALTILKEDWSSMTLRNKNELSRCPCVEEDWIGKVSLIIRAL